ncbi:hypothetical protein HAHE_42380 [Haloferula helveola]|uniref:DUF4405 domain-containing protein n=1 Tax=Haloferula helveola TaxID=490095 RepID=A0ABN6HI48_9BACT|nr:hypothetical protein HAHE_42380 [Haloferula helveola]
MFVFISQALHVFAAFGVFAAIGAVCLAGSDTHRKAAAILHGVSLLVLLLFGLHLLFSQKLVGTGGWWHAKIVIWLVLGAAPAIARRKALPGGALLGICLVLGAIAAFLGLAKPF